FGRSLRLMRRQLAGERVQPIAEPCRTATGRGSDPLPEPRGVLPDPASEAARVLASLSAPRNGFVPDSAEPLAATVDGPRRPIGNSAGSGRQFCTEPVCP